MKSKFAWFGIIVIGLILLASPLTYANDLAEIAANRDAMIEELVQMWFMDEPGWEEDFRSGLSLANDSKLLVIQNAKSYAEVQAILGGGTPDDYSAESMGTPFALGDPDKDYVYTPVKPCRITDTRKAGGKIPSNSSRNFYVHGAGTLLTPQGGNPAGCIAPRPEPGDEPRAAHINIVAVDSTGRGYLTVWPKGTTRPLSSVINYEPGKNDPISNAFTVKTGWHVNHEISIYASKETHVVADVLGYYYEVDKDDFKVRFTGSAPSTSSVTALVKNGGCTTIGNGMSITVPGRGKIMVTAHTELSLASHTSGISDYFQFFLSSGQSDCPPLHESHGYKVTHLRIPTSLASWSGDWTESLVQPVHVRRTFTVNIGGTFTFYLNAKRLDGNGMAICGFPAMQAFYFPDP